MIYYENNLQRRQAELQAAANISQVPHTLLSFKTSYMPFLPGYGGADDLFAGDDVGGHAPEGGVAGVGRGHVADVQVAVGEHRVRPACKRSALSVIEPERA